MNAKTKATWDEFLELLNKATHDDAARPDFYAGRALYHILAEEVENLGPFPRTSNERFWFHKMFRQADVTSSGHKDMVIWCLLNQSNAFHELAESFARRPRARPRQHKKDQSEPATKS